MTFNDSETSTKRYTLRPTFTPLPQSKDAQRAKNAETDTEAKATAAKSNVSSNEHSLKSVIRAANEDDDLYEPYSDYHDGTLKAAEFEKDPWR